MFRGMLTLLGLGVLVAGLAAANLRRNLDTEGVDWQVAKTPPKEVNVGSPTRGPIVQTVTASGVVEPVEESQVASETVGRVVAIYVKEGDHVKADDLLVKLGELDARAKLDSSIARCERLRAAIAQAEADVAKAERDVSQSSRLASKGYSTATELADAHTLLAKAQVALRMTRLEMAESEAMRKTSERDLVRTEIRAPIEGVVRDLNVQVGAVIIAGTTNLPGTLMMTISNLSGMRVRADVDEAEIALVRKGQPAKLYLQSEQRVPIDGTISRVSAMGTRSGEVVTYETVMQVGADHQALRVGMTGTVEIEVRRVEDALGVPVQAVVHRQRKDLPNTRAVRDWVERHAHSPGEKARDGKTRYIKVVFVHEGAVARARPVETGLSDERRVEILSGLRPGDRVIVGPFRTLDELKDGQPVKEVPTTEEPS